MSNPERSRHSVLLINEHDSKPIPDSVPDPQLLIRHIMICYALTQRPNVTILGKQKRVFIET